MGPPGSRRKNARNTTPPAKQTKKRGHHVRDRQFKKHQQKHAQPRDKKTEAAKRTRAQQAQGNGDTDEILDADTLAEMMQLLQRVEADDLPPQTIVLTHHVKRPRQIAQQPGARVILRYTPADPAATAAAEAEDLAQQIEEEECSDTSQPTN